MTRKRKRKTTPHMHDGKKSKAETENQLIMIRLDGGIWWPGYIKEGAGTFFGEEDEYSIRLTKTNHCEYSKDCTKIESSLEKLPQDMKNKYIEDLKQIEASKASCQREAKGDSGTCGIDIRDEPGPSGSGGDIPGETAKSDSGTCGSGIDIHDEPGPSGSGGDIPGETAKSDSGTCAVALISMMNQDRVAVVVTFQGKQPRVIVVHVAVAFLSMMNQDRVAVVVTFQRKQPRVIVVHVAVSLISMMNQDRVAVVVTFQGKQPRVIVVHVAVALISMMNQDRVAVVVTFQGKQPRVIVVHVAVALISMMNQDRVAVVVTFQGKQPRVIVVHVAVALISMMNQDRVAVVVTFQGKQPRVIVVHVAVALISMMNQDRVAVVVTFQGKQPRVIVVHVAVALISMMNQDRVAVVVTFQGKQPRVIVVHVAVAFLSMMNQDRVAVVVTFQGKQPRVIVVHVAVSLISMMNQDRVAVVVTFQGKQPRVIVVHVAVALISMMNQDRVAVLVTFQGKQPRVIVVHVAVALISMMYQDRVAVVVTFQGKQPRVIVVHVAVALISMMNQDRVAVVVTFQGETAKSDSGTCGSGIDIHDEPGPSGSGGDIPGETAKSDSGTCGSGIDIHDEPGPSGSVGDIPGETAKSDSGTCGSGIDIHDEPGPSGSGGDIPGEPSFILDLLSYQGSWEVQESADIELEDSLDISLDKDISSGSEYLPQSGDSDEESFDIERETVCTSTYTDVVANSCSESDDDNGSDVFPMLISTDLEVAINKPAVIEPGDSDSDIEPEDEILRDKEKPGIYIKKVSKSATTKTGKVKKNERVYNSYQFCGVCGKKVSNFAQHIERNKRSHEQSLEIKKIQEETDKKKKDDLRTILRGKFNNAFNMETLKKGKGEILLERRPTKAFNLSDFGPCPKCLLWIAKKLMRKHQKSCVVRGTGTAASSMLITQSDIISKRLTAEASENLVTEVFQVMLNDEVGKVAREDPLLIHLGNIWMEKNVDNKLKRGCYTSQILRLVARLFLQLKEMKPLADGKTLWDYLQPQYFDVLAEATLSIADPSKEDAEDLAKPSNAVKLGYDLKRLINCKIGLSIMGNDQKSRQDAEDLLKTMQIFWGSKVTKLARVLLERRKYNKREQLPMPEDIEKLSTSLKKTITELDLDSVDPENFQHVAEVMSARLLMYNRRRTGELQAIGLEDYQKRKRGDAEAAEKILGECTALEKKLLDDQELMTVRGKTGRGVPVIIPKDCRSGLHFLCNQQIRRAAGIAESNEYIFAYKDGVVRAYDSLAKACRRADLDKCLTSTNLRKYMATMTQVLDLKENELNWVLNHLGHTLDVHKIHYRCTSDVLEKAQIAKILLLQDHGLMGKYHNKTLTDIQLEDLVADQGCDKDMEMEDVLDVSEKMGLEEEEEEVEKEGIEDKKPRKKIKSVPRQGWEWEEEEEIKSLFQKYFSKNEKPKPVNIRKMMLQSKANGGKIHLRKVDILKKKIFRMIDKNSSK
ncbi:uncharacterized protein [Argopecten irradians]|uniref:uncharacterized protein isoform X2 n=1 Tax=Argopecten irradians TaxID=31199 RepID=UPI0037121762